VLNYARTEGRKEDSIYSRLLFNFIILIFNFKYDDVVSLHTDIPVIYELNLYTPYFHILIYNNISQPLNMKLFVLVILLFVNKISCLKF
jgi:hypothetical protein